MTPSFVFFWDSTFIFITCHFGLFRSFFKLFFTLKYLPKLIANGNRKKKTAQSTQQNALEKKRGEYKRVLKPIGTFKPFSTVTNQSSFLLDDWFFILLLLFVCILNTHLFDPFDILVMRWSISFRLFVYLFAYIPFLNTSFIDIFSRCMR